MSCVRPGSPPDSSPWDDCHAVGGMTAYGWEHDPQRLCFQLARYKHIARILDGFDKVLEIGCADGIGARIIRQHVGSLIAVDIDEASVEEARRLASARWPVMFMRHDIIDGPLRGFDAVYALDLFEHVAPEREAKLLANLRACAPVCVIGTPSLESQVHASEISRREHVNCKSGAELKHAMLDHWRHVFLFGMSDETLHTGFPPMCHYLLALGVE